MRKGKIKFDFDKYTLQVEKNRMVRKRYLHYFLQEDYKNNPDYQKLTRQFRSLVMESAKNSIVKNKGVCDIKDYKDPELLIRKKAISYFYGMLASGIPLSEASIYAEKYLGNGMEIAVQIDGNL